MKPAEHERMRRLEDSYWWFVARREAALAFALSDADRAETPGARPRRVLDVGCGTGGLLVDLARRPDLEPYGMDASPAALGHTRDRGQRRLARGDLLRLPYRDGAFDTVFALDVLEHVDDDAAAARELARVLEPGGRLVVSVPAFQFLWSEHDEALEHRRRYTAPGLGLVLESAGLAPDRVSYVLCALFPAVLAQRLVKRLLPARGQPEAQLVPVPSALNRALVGLQRAELALATRLRLPFGLSVLCAARKAA